MMHPLGEIVWWLVAARAVQSMSGKGVPKNTSDPSSAMSTNTILTSNAAISHGHPGLTGGTLRSGSAVAKNMLGMISTATKPVGTKSDMPSGTKKTGLPHAILSLNTAIAEAIHRSNDAMQPSGLSIIDNIPGLIAAATKPADLVQVNKETNIDSRSVGKKTGSTNMLLAPSPVIPDAHPGLTRPMPGSGTTVPGPVPGLIATATKPVDLVEDSKLDSAVKEDACKFFGDIESISAFATTCNASLEWLNAEAKRLKLIKTMSGRSGKKNDRLGFGLSTTPSRIAQCKRTLFKFGLRKNGLFQPSKYPTLVTL